MASTHLNGSSVPKKPTAKKTAPKVAPKKSAKADPALVADAPALPTTKRMQGPRIIDGLLHFSEIDLYRYELAQQKVMTALLSITQKKNEAEKAKSDAEHRQKAYLIEIADLTSFAKTQESELRALQEDLATTYEVDVNAITYDDVTGKIRQFGEDVTRRK